MPRISTTWKYEAAKRHGGQFPARRTKSPIITVSVTLDRDLRQQIAADQRQPEGKRGAAWWEDKAGHGAALSPRLPGRGKMPQGLRGLARNSPMASTATSVPMPISSSGCTRAKGGAARQTRQRGPLRRVTAASAHGHGDRREGIGAKRGPPPLASVPAMPRTKIPICAVSRHQPRTARPGALGPVSPPNFAPTSTAMSRQPVACASASASGAWHWPQGGAGRAHRMVVGAGLWAVILGAGHGGGRCRLPGPDQRAHPAASASHRPDQRDRPEAEAARASRSASTRHFRAPQMPEARGPPPLSATGRGALGRGWRPRGHPADSFGRAHRPRRAIAAGMRSLPCPRPDPREEE